MTITTLHICNAFIKNDLYSNLVESLNNISVNNIVFNATRSNSGEKKTRIFSDNVHISNIIKPYHKLFFKQKIELMLKEVVKLDVLPKVDILHAHFLYSDGALAYKVKQKYGIPYIVAIRNTDVNMFMKYRKDLYFLMKEIIKEASQLVFLNEFYKESFLRYLPRKLGKEIRLKSVVIPNGIDEVYFRRPSNKTDNETDNKTIKLLYVGDFSGNKNVQSIIEASEKLQRENIEVSLKLIGGGGSWHKTFITRYDNTQDYPWINFLGRIKDKNVLRQHYAQADIFVMPSYCETFGLSYIEAISQGTKAICSAGQGIDGYFLEHVVRTVNPNDVNMLSSAIKSHTITPSLNIGNLDLDRFKWSNIGRQYQILYESVTART